MKPVVTRNLMLDFIGNVIVPDKFNCARVLKLNDNEIKSGDILYVMSREFRIEDNWALVYAYNLAKENGRKLKIAAKTDEVAVSNRQKEFLNSKLDFLKKNFEAENIQFDIFDGVLNNIAAVVVDFNPIYLKREFLKSLNCAVFEVDSHNIVPARFISDKQEFSAATLRRKIYGQIGGFLTEFSKILEFEKSEAILVMEDFLSQKLENYSKDKNDPNKNATSNLSKYLHYGLISAQRIAIEVLNSDVSRENKEAFLEELIVRKELADNFCLYAKSHKTFESTLDWAKVTLNAHREDVRNYVYPLKDFENAKTHDELWNAIQNGLMKEGKIHGYLRMYWAKKILEWSISPEEALKTAIYLNDEYALDGNDPNGYVGILWSIGGLHDRPFSNRLVTGKIRYMSYDGCKKKFDINVYIRQF